MVVESDAPYLVARRRAAPELLAAGRAAYTDLLKAYAKCLAAGKWPSFETSQPGSLDSWAPVYLEPWMTQGDGRSDRFFAVAAAPAAA